MNRILVTGASGFIGRHCIQPLLAAGYEVHALTTRPEPLSLDGVTWHRADLAESATIEVTLAAVRADTLLHLAWYTEHGRYWNSPVNVHLVQFSLSLLRRFIEHGGRRAVLAGTCAEYDWRYGLCSEFLTPLAPATLYGACKHALQCIVDALVREKVLSAAWARLFLLYGPYEQPGRMVPTTIRSLLAAEPVLCSDGDQLRDYLYVQDAANALVALVQSAIEGPVNIASGQPVAIGDIVRRLAHMLNGDQLLRLGALPRRADDPDLLVADTHRLRHELGWSPQYGLQQGLGETVKWWSDRTGCS